MSNKKLLFILFITYFIRAGAQSTALRDSSEIPPKGFSLLSITNEGAFSFGAGIGYSTIDLRVYGILDSDDQSFPLSTTPAYNVYADYGISKKTCFGVGFTYQSITGSPPSISYPNGVYEYIVRYNMALRFIHYTSDNIVHSFYYGARIGISYLTDIMSNSQYNWLETLKVAPETCPSIQVFIGYRFLISNSFTFHIEGGIGTPYLIETGFTFRI